MNAKKTLLTLAAVGGITVASLGVVNAVSAEGGGWQNGLVQRIAQKFNLAEGDVQAVFDEDKAEHQAERHQNLEDRLSQAVTDGKITSEQKDLILAKLEELRTTREASHDAMQDKTPEERQAVREAERTALEQWATDNGISTEYLPMFGNGKGGHGPRGNF